MKKWECDNQLKTQNSEFKAEELIKLLLKNRGITTEKEIETFLNPKLADVTIESVGIDQKELNKTIQRIEEAITKQEQIVVFGDYDVDGISGTAILWETFHAAGAKVTPYIPHRVDEGYGLSIKGIDNLLEKFPTIDLIITVDNGIVAFDAVLYAKEKGITVIVTDHHVPSEKRPDAYAIVHTTNLCGTGVAWMLSEAFRKKNPHPAFEKITDHLSLVALATVADLVPLQQANRVLVVYGLKELRKTRRVGLLALYDEAGIDSSTIDVYTIGHRIGPRLNAMGRMEYAMDSLRLICTKSRERAMMFAQKLGETNRDRQQVTMETVLHAKSMVQAQTLAASNLLFIADESYNPGVIGLVAGKLVEEFYRPAIVLSIGEKYAKASARSVNGFNIIEFIRSASDYLVDAGGHPMAAGFTVEREKIVLLQETLQRTAQELLTEDLLTQKLRIDCEIDFSCINGELYTALLQLAPYGMKNPEPVFMSSDIIISDMRFIGKEKNHVKFLFSKNGVTFDAIAFGMAETASAMHVGNRVAIAYSLDMNEWNGKKTLQLKIKDIKTD